MKPRIVVIVIVAGDRDAVGRAEIVGRPEDQHDDDDRDQQDVVDRGT